MLEEHNKLQSHDDANRAEAVKEIREFHGEHVAHVPSLLLSSSSPLLPQDSAPLPPRVVC
jgi:hypothetical protein